MDNKGFTLLEIILVISIIGVLLMMLVPNFGRSQLSARVVTHNSNVKMIQSAGAMYLIDNPLEDRIFINDSSLSLGDLKVYLDLKEEFSDNLFVDPVISKQLKIDKNFKIFITEDGNIKVDPGELEFKNNKLEFKISDSNV